MKMGPSAGFRGCLIGLVLVLSGRVALPQENLHWSFLQDLPDRHGFGGPIVGVHDDALIVCGGANFPDGPPWEEEGRPAGAKVWHDGIYVLLDGAKSWIDAGRLPMPLAYAPSISTPEGIYVLGGESFGQTNHPVSKVLLLTWNSDSRKVDIAEDALPALPIPSKYHGAGLIGDVIYVTASFAETETSTSLDVKKFWSLNLSVELTQRKWTKLEPWPGPAREKMALAVQNSGAHDRFPAEKCLYMFSGANWYRNVDGQYDLSRFEHFSDAYRYLPDAAEWKRIADLPVVPESRKVDVRGHVFDSATRSWRRGREGESIKPPNLAELFHDLNRPAVAATAVDIGQSHILLLSGATGRYVTLAIQQSPLFPRDVLIYHTFTDTWMVGEPMPLGVVTTGATKWLDRIVIPSGEVRPGVRTNKVQALNVTPEGANFGALNFVVLGGYLVVLVLMGVYFSRRERGTGDYFLAGGRIPWWAAGISIYATQLSAITFVSVPALAYSTNWLVSPSQWTILFFAPVVVYFYLPFFRRLNVTTAYEYLERRFSPLVRMFGSLSFIVFQFGRMAIVVYLPALALTLVTGIDIYLCILIMGTLSTLYTVLGGMEAVIWTDVIQVFVLWGGMLLAIVLVVVDLGGAQVVYETARADGKLTMFNWSWSTFEMATWLIVLGNFALQAAPYTTDQAVIQRYMTTRDESAAARSIWLNGCVAVPFGILFYVLGTCLYVFFKTRPEFLNVGMETDQIFPLFMAEHLPTGLSGLAIAGVFAASMSSLDSSMHSVATAATVDFYSRWRPRATDRQRLKVARILTILVGAIGTGIALILAGYDIQSLFFFFQKLLGLQGSGLVAVFFLGVFTRRSNSTGVLSGAGVSFIVLYYVSFHTELSFYLYAIIGIGVAVSVGYLTSFLFRSSEKNLGGLTWWTRHQDLDTGE